MFKSQSEIINWESDEYTQVLLDFETTDICLQRKSDGSLIFVSPEVLSSSLASASASASTNFCNDAQDIQDRRVKWKRDAIICLIDLRKKYDGQFRSTTTKNEVIWQKIVNEMHKAGYKVTSTQCNDKWRYLKSKYNAKKDNMGPRGTGEEPTEFEYFQLLDEFLGNRHNVKRIASSSRGDTVPEVTKDGDDLESEDENETRPKRKKSVIAKSVKKQKGGLATLVDTLQQEARKREESRDRRHKEMVAVSERAIEMYSNKMDQLIKQIGKTDK